MLFILLTITGDICGEQLGLEQEAKAVLPNSATSTHILTSRLLVQVTEEWRILFFQVGMYTLAGIKVLRLLFLNSPASTVIVFSYFSY